MRSSARICWNPLVISTPYRTGKVSHFRFETTNVLACFEMTLASGELMFWPQVGINAAGINCFAVVSRLTFADSSNAGCKVKSIQSVWVL